MDREELRHEHRRGVDTDHGTCTGVGDAPAVIAVAAADIEHHAIGQRREVRQHARPFPVGAPLGVDVDTGDVVRPLAPGMQRQQCLRQCVPFISRQVDRRTDIERTALAIHRAGAECRQPVQRLPPARPVAMRRQIEKLCELLTDDVRPAVHARRGEVTTDRFGVDQRCATSEMKLKHWNHRSERTKPACCRRAWWVCRVSGTSTFSSAVRLRLISRSL